MLTCLRPPDAHNVAKDMCLVGLLLNNRCVGLYCTLVGHKCIWSTILSTAASP